MNGARKIARGGKTEEKALKLIELGRRKKMKKKVQAFSRALVQDPGETWRNRRLEKKKNCRQGEKEEKDRHEGGAWGARKKQFVIKGHNSLKTKPLA